MSQSVTGIRQTCDILLSSVPHFDGVLRISATSPKLSRSRTSIGHEMTSTTSPSESPTNQPEAVQPTKEIFRVPFWTRRLLSNKDEDHEIAYSLQVKGATEGAVRWAIYSTILCGVGHLYWPFFRKQTLAFKGFLVSSATMSGMVIWADYYLLRHEKKIRRADDMMRRQARKELGERGIIATETELNKWKQEQLASIRNQSSSTNH
ncbi:hypothetical protein PGTUg99_016443 [Puccinia graminis f. sp. tritici]|uniref:Uncharacterized protein n=1 Tax=Puccinia graminis f. sp. tritici TaxID=56615 RepID=A0A5B0S3F0_PUCGR|nr:hypothetical protein PGTUg99_016443 [Puccinia graminis f. sp. tritici]